MDVTDDIWLEIFVFLPLNSVFKFKCVSKVWFSLLSNPYFINKWMKHNSSNKSVPWALVNSIGSHDSDAQSSIANGYKRLKTTKYMTYIKSQYLSNHGGLTFKYLLTPQVHERGEDEHMYAIDASNGLVLLSPDLHDQSTYFVCNPLTQNLVSLPSPPSMYSWSLACFICETFPSTSYKVVRIPKLQENTRKFSVEIFSSDMSEWTIQEVSCPSVSWSKRFGSSNDLVSHNGELLWIVKENRILAYNLNLNKCRLIELPADEVEFGGSGRGNLNVSEGLICYTRIWSLSSSLSVWVLIEGDWQLLHKDIKLHDIFVEVKSRLATNTLRTNTLRFVVGLAFDPLDKNVVILNINDCIWAYNFETIKLVKLSEWNCSTRREIGAYYHATALPIVLKLWPTTLPVPSLLENQIISP